MELHEEYIIRRQLRTPIVKHMQRGTVMLRAIPGTLTEWQWLNLNVLYQQEGYHPGKYSIDLYANPVVYVTGDFTRVMMGFSHTIYQGRLEWEEYEPWLSEWGSRQRSYYQAITREEAVVFWWQSFLANFDAWLASFLPNRMIDRLSHSFTGELDKRLLAIQDIQDWLEPRYSVLANGWRNLSQNFDAKFYADWLVRLINNT